MTGEDHTEDALVAALRSPALPAEQAGGAAAVSAMIEARAALTPASRSGLRSRRSVAIASVTVASLGVGGLVAAGPGIFSPAADRPELAPVVTAVETVENPNIVAPDASEQLEGSILVGDTIMVGPLPGPEQGDAPTGDSVDGDTVECAEGNHGATVSSVAKSAEPGPGHGAEVSAAARSDCGKEKSDDDSPSADKAKNDETPAADKSKKADTPAADKSKKADKQKNQSDDDPSDD